MLIKSVVTIALVVVIEAVASLFYIQFNDQSLSIFDMLLSLFESSSYFNDNQDFGLNSEAFKIGQLGRPISNGTRDLSLTQLFTGVEKSVVQITSTSSSKSSYLNRFASNYRLGSGFVYDSNSHIITNSHVVADSKNIEVTCQINGFRSIYRHCSTICTRPPEKYTPSVAIGGLRKRRCR
ncbi:MAG: hypothetical protein ACJ709_00605, partial [Nitrososphaeraceae archaeon]